MMTPDKGFHVAESCTPATIPEESWLNRRLRVSCVRGAGLLDA